MTASSLIGRALFLSRCGDPRAVERAVEEAREGRGTFAVDIPPPPPSLPRGQITHIGGYAARGKTFFLEQQIKQLVMRGYQVVLHQTIGEPRVIEAKRGDDHRTFQIDTMAQLRLQPPAS